MQAGGNSKGEEQRDTLEQGLSETRCRNERCFLPKFRIFLSLSRLFIGNEEAVVDVRNMIRDDSRLERYSKDFFRIEVGDISVCTVEKCF